MAGVGSLAVFLTTVFFLGFDGFWTDIFKMEHIFQNRGRINYLGIIAIFNMVAAISGFFLFKDE